MKKIVDAVHGAVRSTAIVVLKGAVWTVNVVLLPFVAVEVAAHAVYKATVKATDAVADARFALLDRLDNLEG